jgi:MoaA/NifB/PqqE/SkfB family radical SAM enzyme/2-polyprenyl-3-methyl-5-hydroxy-6-metoxy-1,4-benzoquinol methylase
MMSDRVIYLGAIRGTGKTMFATRLAPEIEVGFIPDPPMPIDFPWSASIVREGQPIWPGEWTEDGKARLHDFSHKNEYRDLIGIPHDARVARICGDGFMRLAGGLGAEERLALLREIQGALVEKYDFIVCDMYHQAPLIEGERAVFLAAPAAVIEWRSKSKCWGGRGPYNAEQFIEQARQFAQKEHGAFKETPERVSTLWWHRDRWYPIKEAAKLIAADLGPWYHYAELAGVPVGPKHGLNGEDKWKALRAVLPQKLEGLRCLDVGANAGYNSFQLAMAGATVEACEADPRYRKQMQAIIEMGPYPIEATRRITVNPASIQTVQLSANQYDVAILSAVHYHINRTSALPFRAPHGDYNIPLLRPPLAVVLEGLLYSTRLIVMPTNIDHNKRAKDPYPESEPAWLVDCLTKIGYKNAKINPGWKQCPIVTAEGLPAAERRVPKFQPPVPDSGPAHVSFMLGWQCNASCIMCWQMVARRDGNMNKVQPSYEHIAAVLDRYSATIQTVELCSFGETLLYPEFGRLLIRLRAGEYAAVNLISNGSMLHRYGELGELPGDLTLSVDSPRKETYEQIRRGLHFAPVMHNIRRFVEKRKNPARRVGINMTLLTINRETIVEMAELATELGVDYLSLLRGDTLEMTDAASMALAVNDPLVLAQIAQARQEFPKLQINDYFSADYSAVAPDGDMFDLACMLPWQSLSIGADGVAHPCCRTHDVTLGNAIEGDAWNHPAMLELRKQLYHNTITEETFPQCFKCPMRKADAAQGRRD